MVTAVLDSLAQQQASGILEIDGNPGGGIYFEQGQVTFAWASWVPDLATRLRGALGPAPVLPYLGPGGDQAEPGFGAALVQRRVITADGLRGLLRSAVLDAFIVLTVPMTGESSVADIRFQAPGTHWAAEFCRLRVDTVRAEAARTADRLARYRIAPGTPVRLCDLVGPSAVVSRKQWAVACKIGDAMSASDLAWRYGLALYEAVDCVGNLVRAGLCAPDLSAGAGGPAYAPVRMAIEPPLSAGPLWGASTSGSGGSGPAGSGSAGSGPAGSGPAGSGPAGSGPAGSGSGRSGSAGRRPPRPESAADERAPLLPPLPAPVLSAAPVSGPPVQGPPVSAAAPAVPRPGAGWRAASQVRLVVPEPAESAEPATGARDASSTEMLRRVLGGLKKL